jgi:Cd2+/Zn2+-exporting ATPase
MMNEKRTTKIMFIAGFLLIIALIFHITNLEQWKESALVLSALVGEIPIFIKAYKALKMKAFSIELLVTIAVCGALWIGEYAEASIVTFLFLFGAFLEARTLEKTRSSLQSLIEMAPQEVTVIRSGETVVVPVDEVAEGDRVIIRSGEKVAVDGKVVRGQATLNEASITGESVPAHKTINDQVFSGTIVDQGFIEVIATNVGDETTFARIIELIEEAQEAKSKTQKFLDRFAQVYTPAVVILSILVYFITKNVEMSITFLVIACPGALVIGAPVSIVSGIGNGARHGVLIKGGEVMERIAKLDTVVFDKTGTLTRGRPEVIDIHPLFEKENQFLRLVAEAEMISEHHLGKTIVREAKIRNIPLSGLLKDGKILKGKGVLGKIEGKRIVVGNRKLMDAEKIHVDTDIEAYALIEERKGNTAIYAAIDGKIAGILSIADQIRPEASSAIQMLRQNGIKQVIMLTGDNRHTAELVGRQLKLDAVHAELLPENKVEFVQALKEDGSHVAMAGDGINDAPAIATADVGLAMGEGGTDVSMETADIVLMADRLDQFSHAYMLSKATVRNMKQNTYFAVFIVFFMLLGVLFDTVHMAFGMFIHEASILIVILNAMRLLNFGKRRTQGNNTQFFRVGSERNGL